MLWRILFPFIFIYTIIDGMVSNMLYPAKAPYLFKDFLVLIAFFFFAISEPAGKWVGLFRQRMGSVAWMGAMLFLILGMGQIFNPISPGLLLGILGFKVIYLYWLLAVMAFVYFDSYPKAISFMRMIYYFAVPVNLFGIAQYIMGPVLIFMIYGPTPHVKMDIAAVGDFSYEESFFRVIGTFAASGQYGNFLTINGLFGFALIFSPLIKKREKMIITAAQVLNFSALLAAGSRSSFSFLILSLVIFFVLCRKARTSLLSVALSGVLLFGTFTLLGSKVMSRYESLGHIGMVKERTAGATVKIFMNLFERYPMGKGLGSASTAATHLSKHDAMTYSLIENYPSKLQAELGVVGVIAFYMFTVGLLIRWFDVWLKGMDDTVSVVATLFFAYACTQFLIQGIFFIFDAPPVSLFIWMFVGMGARMMDWRYDAAFAAPAPHRHKPRPLFR